jgi:hypothetical protein
MSADDRPSYDKAQNLRKIHTSCDRAMSTLMNMYEAEEAAALRRVRFSCRSSLTAWLPHEWVTDMRGEFCVAPEEEMRSRRRGSVVGLLTQGGRQKDRNATNS